MVSDEELDEFLEKTNEERDQTIVNEADEETERQFSEMAYIWRAVYDKLEEDNYCFECHKSIINKDSDKTEPMRLIIPKKVDKGVIAFCSVCKDCYEKLEAQQKNNEDKKGDNNAK